MSTGFCARPRTGLRSVNELGVFEMRQTGMFPVTNPSETLLSQRARGASGSVVFCTMRGSRPILCDLQALAARSFYPMPKRTVGGLDSGRCRAAF